MLLRPIAADLGASPAAMTGALTTAILIQAAMAVPVGRWLDRHGGRALMTTGAALGATLLVAWSQVQQVWQLYAVFTGLGVAMAMALYEPATAVIVSWFDAERRSRAILAMIVVAGFASTVFMPLTGLLADRHGWRATLLVLAALYGAVATPLHAAVVRRPPSHPSPAAAGRPTTDATTGQPTTDATTGRPATDARAADARRRVAVRRAVRDLRFWCLAVAFVAHGAAMSAMTVHLVGFLVAQGHPATFAATVAGLLGVLSVTGRLLLTAAGRRLALPRIVAAVFTLQAAAAVSLPLVGGSRAGAIAAVTAFGLGFGVASLATPQLLADRYGVVGYASVAGVLATAVTLAKAGAPLGAAALLAATGYPATLSVVAAAGLTAAAGILARAGAPVPDPLPAGHAGGAGATPARSART